MWHTYEVIFIIWGALVAPFRVLEKPERPRALGRTVLNANLRRDAMARLLQKVALHLVLFTKIGCVNIFFTD